MKAVAFQNRLCRDLDITSANDLPADIRQEILDAINGGLQIMHAVAPEVSKEVIASIPLSAPETIHIGVTKGTTEITGYDFSSDQYYGTLRITGDNIDNQPCGTNELLHPYGGETGTVDAVLYGDAAPISEPYDEVIGDLEILETGTKVIHFRQELRQRRIGRPTCFQMEANARNRNPLASSVIRFDHLPDRLYRLQGRFSLAPVRINFSDLLTPSADIPLRDELIEVYLLPISRSLLTSCRLWRDKDTKAKAEAAKDEAVRKYEQNTRPTLATPRNFVGTKPGY